jgi:hypothetical protein
MPGPGTFVAGDILTADDLNAIGTWTSYTPVVTQSNTVTSTVNYAQYMQINKLVIVNVDLTCTTSGTASNVITVTLPVNFVAPASGNPAIPVGSGFVFDSSATDVILVAAVRDTATTLRFFTETTTSASTNGLGNNPNLTLANDDVISFSIAYRAA